MRFGLSYEPITLGSQYGNVSMGKLFSRNRKRTLWFWAVIAALSLCILLIASRLFPSPSAMLFELKSEGAIQSVLEDNVVFDTPLQVDPERLWQYLIDLPSERFSESDRQTTRHHLTQILEQEGWLVRQQEFAGEDGSGSYRGINVIAEPPQLLNGSDPGLGPDPEPLEKTKANILLIGTHYDTVQGSPGADDNGTGVAAALELAHLLSPQALTFNNNEPDNRPANRPNLALKFVFFDLEELGLLGSEAFVRDDQERQDIAGAIILEMLGYACHTEGCQTYPPLPSSLLAEPPSQIGNFLAVVGDRNHPQFIHRFQIPASIPVYTLAIPTLGPLTPDLLRSDHVPFWRRNIGAVMVTDTANFRNPHYHQESDRPDTLDRHFFTAATQTVLDAVTQVNNP